MMPVSSRKRQARRTSRATSRNGRRSALRSRARSSRRKGRSSNHRARSNGSKSANQAELRRLDAKYRAAVRNFETATRSFYHQNYARAKELFAKVMATGSREIAERARVHVRLCEQKLSKPAPPPKTPADYYNLGVAALNARNLDLAIQLLSKANKAAPQRDEIRYALAAAHAVEGNADAAFEHLKAAIAMRPENRFLARHDEDLEPLRADPRFRELMQAERESKF